MVTELTNPVHMDSPPQMAWTTTNVSEAVPGVPTPLTWDIFERCCERGARLASQRIGLFTAADVDDPHPFHRMFGVFYGRPVISVDRVRWIGDRTPGITADQMELSFFGQVREGVTSSPTRSRYLPMMFRAPTVYLGLAGTLSKAQVDQQAWYERTLRQLEQGRDAAEVLVEAEARLVGALTLHALGTQVANVALGQLTKACAAVGMEGLELEIGTAGGRLIERDLIESLRATARGDLPLETFLARYGYNGPEAFELSAPSWRERPELITATMQRYLDEGIGGSLRDRAQVSQDAVERLLSAGSPSQKAAARLAVSAARRFIPTRELGKALFVQVFDVIRAASRIHGANLVGKGLLASPEDVLLLTAKELVDRADIADIADIRRAQREEYLQVELPRFWVGQPEPIRIAERGKGGTKEDVKGIGASAGVVEGIARVVLDPVDDVFEPGEILVCPVTDPGWVPLMAMASGIVIDSGSTMSHGAIIARELGLPCVIGTGNGTSALTTGEHIRIDGGTGAVTRLSDAPSGR